VQFRTSSRQSPQATKIAGLAWTKADLDSLSITAMVSYGDSTYVLTGNRGVYIVNASSTTDIQIQAQTLSTFVLLQNYPNPFNPSTTIRYGLARRSIVTLGVYNTLGQQVAVLAKGEQEAGFHEVKFDGSAFASGVSFYRIQAGSFVQTKKLVLLH
jgi:hypothetical protein